MILYLLLANLYLAVFYTFYHLFLRKETFFRLNRYYLLGSMVLSFTLPVVNIPVGGQYMGQFVNQGVGQVAERIAEKMNPIAAGAIAEAQHLNERQRQGFAGEMNRPFQWSTGPVRSNHSQPEKVTTFWGAPWSIIQWYALGCLISLLIFLFRIIRTFRAFRCRDDRQGAFSFFNLIRVRKDIEGYDDILQHERVHAREWHSVDVILIHIVQIINWFNPFVYALERALKLQHEYHADRLASGHNRTDYAQLLLATAMETSPATLNNQFTNPSLLKSRIMMLLKNNTPKWNRAKLILILPLIHAMVVVASACNQPGENNQSKEISKSEEINTGSTPATTSTMQTQTEAVVADAESTRVEPPSPRRRFEAKQKPEKPVINGSKEGRFLQHSKDTLRITAADTIPVTNPLQGVATFENIEIPPHFPGKDGGKEGLQGFRDWVAQNVRFPQKAIEAGFSGMVEVSFIVGKDGKLSAIDVRVKDHPDYGFTEAFTDVLTNSPDWKPGIQNGKPVPVSYTIPFRFKSSDQFE